MNKSIGGRDNYRYLAPHLVKSVIYKNVDPKSAINNSKTKYEDTRLGK